MESSEENELKEASIWSEVKASLSGTDKDFTKGSIGKAVFVLIHSDGFGNADGIHLCFG